LLLKPMNLRFLLMMWVNVLDLFSLHKLCSYAPFFSGIIEEIRRLGHWMCWVPKGCESFRRYTWHPVFTFPLSFFFLSFIWLPLFLCWTSAALATANARIASLEAKLSASWKAYDVAKASAEKSQKSALAKAKKTEKALADANKEHSQREQAVTERLRTMSAAAGGKYSPCPLLWLLLRSCTS
jgi:hypothetical protein